MGAMKELMMVSYVHPAEPNTRYRQLATDPLPPWATDLQREIPTNDEIGANNFLAHLYPQSFKRYVPPEQAFEQLAKETLGIDLTGAKWPDDSQKMYVPEIGDRLKLVDPWTFKLYGEYRNAGMITHMGSSMNAHRYGDLPFEEVTLHAGTELSIDRVYIRRGAKEYSSITFNLIGAKKPYGQPGYRGSPSRIRFWAKLDDVNNIVFRRAS